MLAGISDQPPEVTPFPVIPTQGPACWEALSGVWVGTTMEAIAPVSLLNFGGLNTLDWTVLFLPKCQHLFSFLPLGDPRSFPKV